jgi:hypothetical protein
LSRRSRKREAITDLLKIYILGINSLDLRGLFHSTVFPLVINVKLIKAKANTRGNINLVNNRVSDNLRGYLAGLIEGDGSLVTPTLLFFIFS